MDRAQALSNAQDALKKASEMGESAQISALLNGGQDSVPAFAQAAAAWTDIARAYMELAKTLAS
ncbi:hypothetical protein ACFXAZ_12135 [Streptomyces sp. NPDC059477]|uniref:hypothetical protein n=1 Tax=Streptomyces sp. NPDC059477 TaxID=3346847 RepID=UPI0036C28BD7